ncbi:hypothetical protein BGZ95_005114 [Linnemannia exigua]|uniref:Uncharacterized protein n=1 Tax=Linnemannia exigua TaxID=604196 RepID=A0AAD4D2L7_9FUNG|nr:hypothetical protein BGZ95_005114 [Linnemannia exigua]
MIYLVTMAQRVNTRAATPCTIGEPDALDDDWGDDSFLELETSENQEEQNQEEQNQEDDEEDDLEEVEENDYFTPTQTSVAFQPIDFMSHRLKVPSVSTESFPSVLKRSNSSQMGSTKSSKSQNARLNPPPPVQDK